MDEEVLMDTADNIANTVVFGDLDPDSALFVLACVVGDFLACVKDPDEALDHLVSMAKDVAANYAANIGSVQ